MSEETKKRISEALTDNPRRLGLTFKMPEEAKQTISASMMGNDHALGKRYPNRASTGPRPHSEETRAKISTANKGNRGWHGGKTGFMYAAILRPAGFVWIYHFELEPRIGGRFARNIEMDFAHLEGKINIELDGPWHMKTSEEDAERDSILRSFGWHVIRIRHDGAA